MAGTFSRLYECILQPPLGLDLPFSNCIDTATGSKLKNIDVSRLHNNIMSSATVSNSITSQSDSAAAAAIAH